MKKLITIMLILLPIAISAQVWESEDQTSTATCYEYSNRLEVYRAHGIRGWDKGPLVWRKEVKGASVIATRTTDGNWSVVVIERKEVCDE